MPDSNVSRSPAPRTTTPVRYSLLGRAPTRAMSLVPAKSLLPFLAQLNEEQRSVADAGGSMSLRKAREAEEDDDDDGPERAARCRIRRARSC